MVAWHTVEIDIVMLVESFDFAEDVGNVKQPVEQVVGMRGIVE